MLGVVYCRSRSSVRTGRNIEGSSCLRSLRLSLFKVIPQVLVVETQGLQFQSSISSSSPADRSFASPGNKDPRFFDGAARLLAHARTVSL